MIINNSEQKLLDSFVSRFTGKRLRQYVYLQVIRTYDPVSQGKVCNVFVQFFSMLFLSIKPHEV